MEKHTNDFDDVFMTLKTKHTSLFIPLINKVFHKQYNHTDEVTLLGTDGSFLLTNENGTADTEKRIADSLLKIRNDMYLIECQSYNDGSMVVRMAEYTFLAGARTAVVEGNRLVINLPNFTIVYVKSDKATPHTTEITYRFPDGQSIDYASPNVLVVDYSIEDIFREEMYLFIPFYLARYQNEIRKGTVSVELVEKELRKILSGLEDAVDKEKLTAYDLANLKGFTNKLIEHIYYDRENEKERLVNVMGGKVLVTEADLILEKGIRQGKIEGKIETYLEIGLTIPEIAEKMNLTEDKVAETINMMKA